MSVPRIVASLSLLVLFLAPAAMAQPYYRWSSAPAFTCVASGGMVNVTFASQPAEWSGPGGTLASIDYISNGVLTPSAPFPIPSPSGSMVFSALLVTAPTYPATVTVRLNTIFAGVTVYQSSMSASCSADGGGVSTITNTVPSIPALGPAGMAGLAVALALAGAMTLTFVLRRGA